MASRPACRASELGERAFEPAGKASEPAEKERQRKKTIYQEYGGTKSHHPLRGRCPKTGYGRTDHLTERRNNRRTDYPSHISHRCEDASRNISRARPDESSLGMKTRPDESSLGMKTRPDETFLRMKFKKETELFFLLPVCSNARALVDRLEVPREAKRYGLTKIGLISFFPLKRLSTTEDGKQLQSRC